jgi:hypothetical protein
MASIKHIDAYQGKSRRCGRAFNILLQSAINCIGQMKKMTLLFSNSHYCTALTRALHQRIRDRGFKKDGCF